MCEKISTTNHRKMYDLVNEISDCYMDISSFDKRVASIPDFDPNEGGQCGWTILVAAVRSGDQELIRHIAERYPTLLELGDEFGLTPLHGGTVYAGCHAGNHPRGNHPGDSICCFHEPGDWEYDNLPPIKLLLELGANVNTLTRVYCGVSWKGAVRAGSTALDIAVEHHYWLLAEVLLAHGGVVSRGVYEACERERKRGQKTAAPEGRGGANAGAADDALHEPPECQSVSMPPFRVGDADMSAQAVAEKENARAAVSKKKTATASKKVTRRPEMLTKSKKNRVSENRFIDLEDDESSVDLAAEECVMPKISSSNDLLRSVCRRLVYY